MKTKISKIYFVNAENKKSLENKFSNSKEFEVKNEQCTRILK